VPADPAPARVAAVALVAAGTHCEGYRVRVRVRGLALGLR
jgi:hypothetical protein